MIWLDKVIDENVILLSTNMHKVEIIKLRKFKYCMPFMSENNCQYWEKHRLGFRFDYLRLLLENNWFKLVVMVVSGTLTALCYIWPDNGGIFKSYSRVP